MMDICHDSHVIMIKLSNSLCYTDVGYTYTFVVFCCYLFLICCYKLKGNNNIVIYTKQTCLN